MEYENKHDDERFGKRGVSNTALGLSIGALGAELLGGNLGGILGGGRTGGDGHCINRYEMSLIQESAAKDSKIALLESNIYVDSKIADVYERLNGKIAGLEAQICQQGIVNAQVAANLGCMQNSINALNALTKLVVPIASICPTPAVATPTTGA
jgi:hypothetical protein